MDFVTVTAQSDNTVVIVPSKIDITLGTGDKIMLFSNMTNLIPKCKALVIKWAMSNEKWAMRNEQWEMSN